MPPGRRESCRRKCAPTPCCQRSSTTRRPTPATSTLSRGWACRRRADCSRGSPPRCRRSVREVDDDGRVIARFVALAGVAIYRRPLETAGDRCRAEYEIDAEPASLVEVAGAVVPP